MKVIKNLECGMFKFLLLTFTLRGDKLTVKYEPSYHSHIYLYSIIIGFNVLQENTSKLQESPLPEEFNKVEYLLPMYHITSLSLSLIPYLSSSLWDQSRRERVSQKVRPGPAPRQVPHSR